MKICLVTLSYPLFVDGISKNVFELSLELAKDGNEVTVFYPSDIPPIRKHYKNVHSCRVFSLGRPLGNPILPTLFYHMLRSNCDLIHSHDGFFSGTLIAFVVSKIKNKPFIVTHHTNPLNYSNFFLKLLQSAYMKYIMRAMYSNSSIVLVPNEENKCILQSMGIKNVSVLRYGIHPEIYKNCTPSRLEDIRDRFGIKNGDRVLLFVGRFVKRKGILNLLEVYKNVLRENKNTKLILVGDGPLMSNVRKFIKENHFESNVILTGYIGFDEVALMYKISDLTVVPSLEGETQCIVLLESILSGTPIVASDLAVFKNLVTTHVGLSSSLGDTAEMSEKIIHLLNNKSELDRLNGNCLNTDLSQFYWENVIKELNGVYHKFV